MGVRDSHKVTLYKDWAPTGFDPKGLMAGYSGDEDYRGNWIVAPVMRNRDSERPYDFYDSNWYSMLKLLGGESETVEIHRFGHWANGWFEIALVHPSREEEVREIIADLENYPLLDEDDHSEREYQYASSYWGRESVKGRIDIIHEFNERYHGKIPVFAARHDYLPDDPDGRFFEYLTRD